MECLLRERKIGPRGESNSGPLAPEARIIPLDQQASSDSLHHHPFLLTLIRRQRSITITHGREKVSVWLHQRNLRPTRRRQALHRCHLQGYFVFLKQWLTGVLSCLDGFLNVVLEQAEEYVDGEFKSRYNDCFIRGNHGFIQWIPLTS